MQESRLDDLHVQMAQLAAENKRLLDRNDELTSVIEALRSRTSAARFFSLISSLIHNVVT